MKHFILTAAAAAALIALGSCSKIETVGVSDANYIGFDNAYIGNPTKAVTEVTDQKIDKFFVFGGPESESTLFTNVEVTKGQNGWTYVDQKEWTADTDYKFAAYYNDESLTNPGNVSFEYTSGALTFTDFESSPDHQADLLYDELTYRSKAEGTTNDKMQFNFRHLLSIVKFTFNSGFAEGVTVTVSDMDFYGMNSKGTATPTEDEWAWAPNTQLTEGYGFSLFGDGNQNNIATSGAEPTSAWDNCIVIPQTWTDNADNHVMVAKFTVTLDGTGLDDVTTKIKEITAYLPADTWKPGYRYNYVATISGQTMDYIEFDAPDVTKWDDEADINMVNDESDGNDGEIIVGQ